MGKKYFEKDSSDSNNQDIQFEDEEQGLQDEDNSMDGDESDDSDLAAFEINNQADEQNKSNINDKKQMKDINILNNFEDEDDDEQQDLSQDQQARQKQQKILNQSNLLKNQNKINKNKNSKLENNQIIDQSNNNDDDLQDDQDEEQEQFYQSGSVLANQEVNIIDENQTILNQFNHAYYEIDQPMMNLQHEIKEIRNQVDMRSIKDLQNVNKNIQNLESKIVDLNSKQFFNGLAIQQELKIKDQEIKRLKKLLEKERTGYNLQLKINQQLKKQLQTQTSSTHINDNAFTQQTSDNLMKNENSARMQQPDKEILKQLVDLQDQLKFLEAELEVNRNENENQKKIIQNYRQQIENGKNQLETEKISMNEDKDKINKIREEMINLVDKDSLQQFNSSIIKQKYQFEIENYNLDRKLQNLEFDLENTQKSNEENYKARKSLEMDCESLRMIDQQRSKLQEGREYQIVNLEKQLQIAASKLIKYEEMKNNYQNALQQINNLNRHILEISIVAGLKSDGQSVENHDQIQNLENKNVQNEQLNKSQHALAYLSIFVEQVLGWKISSFNPFKNDNNNIQILSVYGTSKIIDKSLVFQISEEGQFKFLNNDIQGLQLKICATDVPIQDALPFTLAQIQSNNFYNNNLQFY